MSDKLDNTLEPVVSEVGQKETGQSTLDDLANKISATAADVEKQRADIKDTNTLTKLGFYIIIVMLATIIVSVIFFEIQTINDNNARNYQMLQQINNKL